MPINNSEVTFQSSGENSVLIVWPEKVCPKQHQEITQYQRHIKMKLSSFVVETVSSYNSLMVYYRFDLISFQQFTDKLLMTWKNFSKITIPQTDTNTDSMSKTIEIPVYYGADAGWDLQSLSDNLDLSIEDIISLHSKRVYHAYALGFTPGFCYLASIDKSLQVSRKEKPRLVIPKGAVAIAEQQTAVYPLKSPGGWHIVGQTPIEMFSATDNSFSSTITVGQQVFFNPINKDEFHSLGGIVEAEF
jgi:inhibitor of KinA